MKKIIAVILACLLLTSCADLTEEYNDSPVSGNDDSPAFRIAFPDGYSNVARKCDGSNMVYSSRNSKGVSVDVVKDDPRCGG